MDRRVDELSFVSYEIAIPLYMKNRKMQQEYEKNPVLREKKLVADYQEITERLEILSIQGEITAQEWAMLLDMSKKVLEHIAKNFQKVGQEVREIMGESRHLKIAERKGTILYSIRTVTEQSGGIQLKKQNT